MEKVKQFIEALEDYGLHLALMVAGLFGALMSIEDKKGLTGWQKVTVFAYGLLMANYLPPLLLEWSGTNANGMFGVGFLLGYVNLKGLKLLIIYIKGKLSSKD